MVKCKLMDAVPLDPGDYGGSYKAAAGRMSLDFVNTMLPTSSTEGTIGSIARPT